MKTEKIKITSLKTGEQREADLIICPHCNGRTFLIYVMHEKGDTHHDHLQCRECGYSYCDGSCGRGWTKKEGGNGTITATGLGHAGGRRVK